VNDETKHKSSSTGNPPTPQSTIDAVKYTVQQRGIAALSEPENLERLSQFDDAARRQLNTYLARFEKASA